jgi:hypothetical protein
LFDHWYATESLLILSMFTLRVENRHLSIEGESYHPDPSDNEGLLYKVYFFVLFKCFLIHSLSVR